MAQRYPSNLSGLDESDPRAMARWMRKMGKEMGEELGGEDFDEMIDEMEGGKMPDDEGGDLGVGVRPTGRQRPRHSTVATDLHPLVVAA